MANLYMQRHVQDLGRHFRVLKLMQVTPEHTEEGAERPSMTKQIRNHIEARVDREYPAAVFGHWPPGTTELPTGICATNFGPHVF